MQDLVAEVARVRRNKIQAGLRELHSALSAVKLLNLGFMEVNQIRPFFQASLDRFFRLSPVWAPGMLLLYLRCSGLKMGHRRIEWWCTAVLKEAGRWGVCVMAAR